jgi:hypothetical protein
MNNDTKPTPAPAANPSKLDMAAASTAIRQVAALLGESPVLAFFTGPFTQTHTDLKTLLQYHGQPVNIQELATEQALANMPRAWQALESELKLLLGHVVELAEDPTVSMPESLQLLAAKLATVLE